MSKTKSVEVNGGCAFIFVILFMLTPFAGWATHLYRCFNEEQWGFLIAGALAFPIGIIHGIGIWFGLW